jgi:hypothetical protein
MRALAFWLPVLLLPYWLGPIADLHPYCWWD